MGANMNKISNKRGIAFAFGGAIIGSLLAQLIRGDMLTKFLITFPVLFATMIAGIYFLNRQAKSKEGH